MSMKCDCRNFILEERKKAVCMFQVVFPLLMQCKAKVKRIGYPLLDSLMETLKIIHRFIILPRLSLIIKPFSVYFVFCWVSVLWLFEP